MAPEGEEDASRKRKGRRTRKHGPMPPLKSSDIRRMLRHDGWFEVKGGRHENWEHGSKPGKVQLSVDWSGVKIGSDPFKGLLRQTGWSKKDAIRIYWESRGK